MDVYLQKFEGRLRKEHGEYLRFWDYIEDLVRSDPENWGSYHLDHSLDEDGFVVDGRHIYLGSKAIRDVQRYWKV